MRKAIAVGSGTTKLCTGNGLRMDEGLKKIGINLDEEFEELYREIPVSTSQRLDVFLGTVNAGHPGGMLQLTEREAFGFSRVS